MFAWARAATRSSSSASKAFLDGDAWPSSMVCARNGNRTIFAPQRSVRIESPKSSRPSNVRSNSSGWKPESRPTTLTPRKTTRRSFSSRMLWPWVRSHERFSEARWALASCPRVEPAAARKSPRRCCSASRACLWLRRRSASCERKPSIRCRAVSASRLWARRSALMAA